MNVGDFAFHVLPYILGILLVGYSFVLIYGMRSYFFQVVRSWIVTYFIIVVAALWLVELFSGLTNQLSRGLHAAADMTFVVVAMWLSNSVVMAATRYAKYSSVRNFVSLLKKRPVNLLTAWGATGAVVIAAIWAIEFNKGDTILNETWLLWAITAYLVLSIAMNIVLPIRARAQQKLPRLEGEAMMGMAMLAIAWVGIPTAEFGLDVVLDLRLGYGAFNPGGWIVVVLFAAMARSFTESGAMAIIVDPAVETAKREGFRSFDIPRGVYLTLDEKADPALDLFSELVTLPLKPDAAAAVKDESASATLQFLIPRGLVVTREFPDTVREKHKLQVTPMIWLTEAPGERRIAPTSLAVLTDTLIRFMETNPNSIVLIEGVEYIITFNDFKKVLRSLDSLNETAWLTKARLMITVNPKAFDDRDLALLERDRKVVTGKEGIVDLKRESML